MHIARLLVITELKNVPPDMRPFVDFKAAVEERKLEDDEMVAVLVVDTTTSYIPVFLKPPLISLAEVERQLGAQDAKLSADTREVLARHLPA